MTEFGGHPKLQGYDAFYEREIRPIMEAGEIYRSHRMGQFYKFGLIPLLAGIGYSAFLLQQIGLTPLLDGTVPEQVIYPAISYGGMALLTGGALSWGIYKFIKILITATVHMDVMPKLCDFLGLEYSKSSTGRVQPDKFHAHGILPNYDESHFEDEIFGNYNNVDVSLVEAKLVKVSRSSGSGKGSSSTTSRTTVFQGLLLECDFHRRFRGETSVARNAWLKISQTGDRVPMEDPEFEKRYDVFSNNEMEARRLLSPRFRERILKLDELTGAEGLQLAFVGDNLLLALAMKEDQFEIGSVLKNMNDKSRIDKIAGELCILFEVVDILGLDETKY